MSSVATTTPPPRHPHVFHPVEKVDLEVLYSVGFMILDLKTSYFPGTPKPSSGKAFGGKLPKGKDIVLSVMIMVHLAEVQYSSNGQARRCGDGKEHRLDSNKFVKMHFLCNL